MVTAGGLDLLNRKIGCVGVPLPGCDIRIVNGDGQTVEGGEMLAEGVGLKWPGNAVAGAGFRGKVSGEGEIVVWGGMVMQGYHRNPRADNEVFFWMHKDTGEVKAYDALKGKASVIGGEGVGEPTGMVAGDNGEWRRYFKTGDMGRIVDGKFLQITGRIKEQYKLSNGKYVVPSPLEDLYTRNHNILQCFLFGDNKPFNVLLVVPNWLEVKGVYEKKGEAAVVADIDVVIKGVGVGGSGGGEVEEAANRVFLRGDFVELMGQAVGPTK